MGEGDFQSLQDPSTDFHETLNI